MKKSIIAIAMLTALFSCSKSDSNPDNVYPSKSPMLMNLSQLSSYTGKDSATVANELVSTYKDTTLFTNQKIIIVLDPKTNYRYFLSITKNRNDNNISIINLTLINFGTVTIPNRESFYNSFNFYDSIVKLNKVITKMTYMKSSESHNDIKDVNEIKTELGNVVGWSNDIYIISSVGSNNTYQLVFERGNILFSILDKSVSI